ncbi:MAG: adenine phosphoribosyltransferase [Pseudomonadota bacterium]
MLDETVKAMLYNAVRTIPDYPKPGVQFRDITTLLSNAQAFKAAVSAMVAPFRTSGITQVAGIEARGFILGGAAAYELGVGFVPMRKRGKLPFDTIGQDYDLEYGTDRLEMHVDAVQADDQILLIDDLVATGGTALAAIDLLQLGGACVTSTAFVIDLPDLGGLKRIESKGVQTHALLAYPGE